MATNTDLDPFSSKAENTKISIHDKISGFHKIVTDTKTGMLTTRSADGHLHSRAMHPSSFSSDTQVNLFFVVNNASHKCDELKQDSHVNVSFYDTSSTSWVSVSGQAQISRDKDLIHKHWSRSVGAYFGDLKDGVHKGDEHDPRVSIIQVVPDEVRYWLATQGAISKTVNTAVSATTGRVSVPGELRTITKEEVKLTEELHANSSA